MGEGGAGDRGGDMRHVGDEGQSGEAGTAVGGRWGPRSKKSTFLFCPLHVHVRKTNKEGKRVTAEIY